MDLSIPVLVVFFWNYAPPLFFISFFFVMNIVLTFLSSSMTVIYLTLLIFVLRPVHDGVFILYIL